ncbi:bacteriohemerythrin [Dongia sp.]|uniref:bacteriohemerythrin n=1 Tax=Dongia sp. TaxID=1977262 RepID=UPI0035AF3AC3
MKMAYPSTSNFTWSAAFETGNAEIDAQHMALIDGSKKLKELVRSGGDWDEVKAGLAHFTEICLRHFRYEEQILEQVGFPRYAEHVAQHHRIEVMLQEFGDMVARADGDAPEHRELVASLEIRIIDLIVRHDLDYKSHLMNIAGY